MKKIILISLSFVLLASTTTLGQGFTKPTEGKAVIYIVDIMLGFGHTKIFNQDGCIGLLKSRDYLRYECDPGHHVILGLDGANKDYFTADVEAGKIYIVQMRSIEKMGGQAPDFKAIANLSEAGKKEAIQKIVNENAPNSFSKEELDKINDKWQKFAQKAFDKYETKLKAKGKFAHVSKEMFYKE